MNGPSAVGSVSENDYTDYLQCKSKRLHGPLKHLLLIQWLEKYCFLYWHVLQSVITTGAFDVNAMHCCIDGIWCVGQLHAPLSY